MQIGFKRPSCPAILTDKYDLPITFISTQSLMVKDSFNCDFLKLFVPKNYALISL
jgi:hypothetical protein